MGMPALAMTDHGNVFGAYDFYKKATAAGVKPIIGMEAYLTPGTHRCDRTRVRWADGGERRRLRRRRVHPHDPAGREHRGHAQPVPAVLARPASRASSTSRGWTASCSQQYADGPDRHHRLPVRRGPDLAAASASTTRRAPGRGRVPRHLRRGQLLPRADGPRARASRRRVRDDLLRLAKDLEPAAGRHQRPALHPRRGRRRRTRCCSASSPARRWPTRTGSSSTRDDFYLKSPGRDARALGRQVRPARGLRQHAADRRAVRGELRRGRATYMPRFPVPDGETEQSWFVKEVERGLRRALSRTASRTTCAQQAEYEIGVIVADGLPGLLPGRRRLHQLGQGQRHPGRPGPRLGRRLDRRRTRCGITDLDPLEHGLIFERFLNPDRVSMPDFDVDFDERRRGEVIRYVTEKYGDGPGRADRHLRHDQGQAGGQGRRPGARLPVRDGRADHQGRCRRR